MAGISKLCEFLRARSATAVALKQSTDGVHPARQEILRARASATSAAALSTSAIGAEARHRPRLPH